MTTFSDLIEETRHSWLMTGQPDRLNVLDVTVDNVTTTIQLRTELLGLSVGSRLCIDLEEMHVLSMSGTTAGSQVEVIRGFGGSTAAAHTAGTKILVNPQFTDFRIAKHLNQALDDLSGYDLYRVLSTDFTYVPATAGYNLTLPNFLSIYKVSYDAPGPANDWPVIDNRHWDINFSPDPTEFPGGTQLVIKAGGSPGRKIRVAYRASFTQLSNLADDVLAVSGLHREAHDIPPMIAALDLLAGRDIKRSFLNRQPERRRQEEVPPGSAQQAMGAIVNVLQGRLTREVRRLRRRYPEAL